MSNQETMISLQSYAAVMAGLGAGLSLRRALAHAGVPAPTWEAAAADWQSRIDESAASDLVELVAFDGALLDARRRFEPSIEPIASDPRAWAQFRRHFVTASAPVAFLAERDLSLGTYARLEAEWTNKILSDAALAATFQGYMDAPLLECPTLTVTPSPLLRDDALPALETPAPEVQPLPPPRPALPPLVTPPAVLPSYLLETPAPPVAPPPVALPPVALPPVAPPPIAPPPVAPRARPAPLPDLGRTGIVEAAPVTAPMPFVPAAPSPFPFRGAGEPAGAPLPPAAPPRPRPAPRIDLGRTVDSSTPILSPVLPFARGGPGPAPAGSTPRPVAVPPPVTGKGASPPTLQSTVIAVGPIAGPAVPFREASSPASPHDPPSPLPELSVDQYAWIVARLRQAAPADVAGALASLRLTPETREQLEAHWRVRMGRDPALQQAFITALGRFVKGKGKGA